MITIKKRIKTLTKYTILYSLLIAFVIGLRLLHHMEINWNYYLVIGVIIFCLLVVFSFIEPKHLERILPKNSKVSLMVVLTLRFLPLSKQKISNIKDNQEMRGASFRGFAQVRNYLSLLIPAIIAALRWSDNVSEGILMRGGD